MDENTTDKSHEALLLFAAFVAGGVASVVIRRVRVRPYIKRRRK